MIKSLCRLAVVFGAVAIFPGVPSAKQATGEPTGTGALILRAGEGEELGNGIVAKLSPSNGTESEILVEQTFPRGADTTIHTHEQGGELFYVVSGSGFALVDGNRVTISSGDVVFVPRNVVHQLGNSDAAEPMTVVFFMSTPELVDEFRRRHSEQSAAE